MENPKSFIPIKLYINNIKSWLGIKTMEEFGYEYAAKLRDEEIRFLLRIDNKFKTHNHFEKGMEQCLLDRWEMK